MKYLETFENYLILEIGEAKLPPYDIDNKLIIPTPFGPNGHNYYFNTESGLRYSINIMDGMTQNHIRRKDVNNCKIVDDVDEFYISVIGVSFFTFTGDDEDAYYTYDDKVITNKGELFRIMSTLKLVIEDFISKNSNIKYVFIGGQRGEKRIDKEQRDKLYIAYIKKLRPDWIIDKIYCEFMDETYYLIKIKT